MKPKFFIIALAATMLMACQPEPEPSPNPDDPLVPVDSNYMESVSDLGPPACMMIVRFANPEQIEHVIVGHPIKKYNTNGYFEYYCNQGMTLNAANVDTVPVHYVMDSNMLQFLTENTDIAGSSPFIPLGEDYYLIDWKWQSLCPLSCIVNYCQPWHLQEHVQQHIFVAPTTWPELNDYLQVWDSIEVQHIDLAEYKITSFEVIDRFFGEVKDYYEDPFMHYGYGIYYEGLSVRVAYLYYPDGGPYPVKKSYQWYIHACDSLQEIYKNHLIQFVNHNQLDDICFQ